MKSNLVHFGKMSVWINILGIITSGLLFPVLTAIFHPQPEWQGAERFIGSFHPLQTATFFCGFFLVTGSLLTFSTLYLMSGNDKKQWSLPGVLLNGIFTAIVFLNYILQTTYVPYLANQNPPEATQLLAAFSMSNPGSFAWALEMYGWGGIGLSYLFMANIFEKQGSGKIIRILFIVNGTCSILSALMTSVNMKWLFSPAGFISLITWNLLVLAVDFFLLRYFREIPRPVKIKI